MDFNSFSSTQPRGLPTTLAGLRGSPRGSSGNAGVRGGGGGMRSTKESTAKGDTTGHGKIRYVIHTCLFVYKESTSRKYCAFVHKWEMQQKTFAAFVPCVAWILSMS